MIRVLFFAKIREVLGTDGVDFDADDRFETVEDLRDELCREEGEVWEEVLCGENVIVSVNHTVVDLDCAVKDGDEVAFYPPVTGG